MTKPQAWGWRPWLLLGGLALSLLVAGVFAARGLQHVPRRQVDEPIHGWMSVPYVARAYGVPASSLYAALGLPARPPDRRPIMLIARAQNRPVTAVIADLQNAIVQARQPGGTATPAPGVPTPAPTAP